MTQHVDDTATDLDPDKARPRLEAYWDAVHRLDRDSSEGRLEGRTAFTYKEVSGGEYLDSKKLRESYPDVHAAFLRPRAGHRSLKVKP